MRIFVAGATGYIGQAVVRELVAAGHAVTGLARSAAKAKTVAALGATARAGDLTDPAGLAAAAADHDVLIHVANFYGEDRPVVDRAATFALIDGARATAAPRHVIYTSGVWTLGNTGAIPAGEDAPTDRAPTVSTHRVSLERDVVAAAGGDLATTVVRPGDVYGGREGVASWLADWLPGAAGRSGIVHIGDGTNRWSLIERGDLARFYRRVVERRAEGMLHAVEDESVRVADLAAALSRASGLPVSSWPEAEARAALGAPMTEALLLDQVVAMPRARALLGWRPERPPFLRAVDAIWAQHRARD